MKHKLFKDEKSYLNWANRTPLVGDLYDKRHELIEFKPVRYPVITVYEFEKDFDRMGTIYMFLFEHVYLDEFNGFDPYAEEKRYKRNVERKNRKVMKDLEKMGLIDENGFVKREWE